MPVEEIEELREEITEATSGRTEFLEHREVVYALLGKTPRIFR